MSLTTPDQPLLCIFGSRPSQRLCPPRDDESAYQWTARYAELLARRIPKDVMGFMGDTFPQLAGLVSGCADGGDRAGELWAEGFHLPIHPYWADWRKFGSGAGFLRNIQMAQVATHFLAYWDGESPGTRHMIRQVQRKRKGKGLGEENGEDGERRLMVVRLGLGDFI